MSHYFTSWTYCSEKIDLGQACETLPCWCAIALRLLREKCKILERRQTFKSAISKCVSCRCFEGRKRDPAVASYQRTGWWRFRSLKYVARLSGADVSMWREKVLHLHFYIRCLPCCSSWVDNLPVHWSLLAGLWKICCSKRKSIHHLLV